MKRTHVLVFLFAALLAVPQIVQTQSTRSLAPPAAPAWKIDVAHSELSFSIRHLVSRVRGQFDVWSGTIVADPADWSTASVEVTAQTASVNTNNERRDADLRSTNHFDAESNPTVTFRSTRVERVAQDSLRVTGNLTIHGITRPVILLGHFNGMIGNPGSRRAGFEASALINRKDFDMTWNRIVEGGQLLGDEVRIDIQVAAVEQPK
ncbi:MAG: YceI family protein [Gemmatimonadaceae bacterium]